MSKTAAGLVEKLGQQEAEDKRTGEAYDSFFQSGGFEEEEKETEELERENNAVAAASEEARQTQGAVVGSQVKEVLGSRAAGFRGELTAVQGARTMYPSYLANFLKSNATITIGGQKMSVKEAIASGNPAVVAAAIQQGRFQFIKEMGLHRASKDVMVKNLLQPMMAAEGSLASSLTTAAIADRQKAEQARIEGLAYNADSSTDLQTQWDNLSTLMYSGDTGLTRSEANEKALDAMIAGMVARGDVEGLRELRGLNKVRNPDGTYQSNNLLGDQYGQKIDEAIVQC